MSVFCDEDLPPYGQNGCPVNKVSGISAVAYLRRGQTTITDFTNPVQWEAAIAAGDATISDQLNVELPAGSPINIDNKRACGSAQVQIGADYTANITDPNVSPEHDVFYTTINGKAYDVAYFYCAENEIRVIRNVTVSALLPLNSGNRNDTQHYPVTHTFRLENNDFGEYLEAPAGIFN